MIKVSFDTYEECIGWAVKYGLDLSKHSPSYLGSTKKWVWELEGRDD